MSKQKYNEPNISYHKSMNLWYSYQDDSGNQRVERLQFLPVAVFLQFVERLCSQCECASDKLPGLLEQLRIDNPIDRWWLLCQVMGYGATLDAVCADEPIKATS